MKVDIYTLNLHIRSIIPSDKDLFMSLRKETGEIASYYEEKPGYKEFYWQNLLECKDEHNMMVFRKADREFLASCSFQYNKDGKIELGVDVVKEYRGQGIGTEILRELSKNVACLYPEKVIFICMRKENTASKRMTEKAGGVFIGTAPTPEAENAERAMEIAARVSRESYLEMKEIYENGREGLLVYRISGTAGDH